MSQRATEGYCAGLYVCCMPFSNRFSDVKTRYLSTAECLSCGMFAAGNKTPTHTFMVKKIKELSLWHTEKEDLTKCILAFVFVN